MVTNLLVVLVSILFISEHFRLVSTIEVVDVVEPDDVCDCKEVDVVSNRDVVLRKHGDVLGRYTKIEGVQGGLATPSYVHFSGKFFLYYSSQSQGFWAVGETLGGEIVRLENQGDHRCPYYLKSIWRYADGELNSLVYDISLKVACMSDPCSVAHCGHKARCVNASTSNDETTLNDTTTMMSTQIEVKVDNPSVTCACDDNFEGDPFDRCYPTTLAKAADCDCRRLIFSTHNPLAASKHANSYGEFFLYDVVDGSPIYQHFAGIDYLYERGGHWLISDKIGLQEAGLQNQGDIGGPTCPYLLRSSWEYADVDQPGWQWVYDYTANLMCPLDPCSVNKCGYHATCVVDGGRHRTLCACDSGYEGDPYERCYPKAPSSCGCKILEMSSIGQSALAQADKMGSYYLHGYYNRRPAYQHQSGLDYLYYADGEAWVVGATFGGPRVGIVNFEHKRCPYQVTTGTWRHSVNGKLERDSGIVLVCVDPAAVEGADTDVAETVMGNTTVVNTSGEIDRNDDFEDVETDTENDQTTEPPSAFATSTAATFRPFNNATFRPAVPTTTIRPTKLDELTIQRQKAAEQKLKPIRISPNDLSKDESSSGGVSVIETTLCDCPEIEVTSKNPTTIEKHGSQLGRYRLIRVQGGRPIYQHIDTEIQFLYYHPYSGGNWLINSEVGLLYGGIQNSKDSPLCPYLINTMWQYGDGDLHGWVYDSSLKVTCPTDACSVLRCGFRADCVRDSGKNSTRCQCQAGFSGNPHERCYPDDPLLPCACKKIKLSSIGPASEHQRDKLGTYFLWGKSNNKPVYQHESGLDFMYYHTNHVWGVGPKVGGNSAGLLNFGRQPCPYDLVSPWEFGTRQQNGQRQTDTQLKLVCLDQPDQPTGIMQNAPAPLKAGMNLVNNALSFVASIGNKFSPQTSGSSAPPPSSISTATSSSSSSNPNLKVQPPPSNLCGWTSYGQDGGNSFGVHPWHASITVVKGDDSEQTCVGVIASPRHVVTTASCVSSHPMNSYRVIIGDIVPDRREEFSVQSIVTHDDFSDSDGSNDVAVVTLKQRFDAATPEKGRFIVFDGIVRPLCLPEVNATQFFDHCETLPFEASRQGYIAQIEGCSTPEEEEKLICAKGQSKATSPLVCRDSRLRLAVIAGLPTKNCHLDCTSKLAFLPMESHVAWIKTRLTL